MHRSLSPRTPEVVTEASAFRPDFVATDFADIALVVRCRGQIDVWCRGL